MNHILIVPITAFLTFIGVLFMTGCTFNVSMAHTSGTADDVIEDTSCVSPNVSPKIVVPLTPGSEVTVTK